MDLSDNRIADLSPLSGLERLEELNLADNLISDIDAIGNLVHLKSVNLANNRIEDLSPLLELENLEQVDLTGNPVPSEQLKTLTDLGIKVYYLGVIINSDNFFILEIVRSTASRKKTTPGCPGLFQLNPTWSPTKYRT